MRSTKKYMTPVDMEVVNRAHRSIWTMLKQENGLANSNEARELSDRVTRKLVGVAREGIIDLATLRESTLAAIAVPGAKIGDSPDPEAEKSAAIAHDAIHAKSESMELPRSSLWISRITLLIILLGFVVALT